MAEIVEVLIIDAESTIDGLPSNCFESVIIVDGTLRLVFTKRDPDYVYVYENVGKVLLDGLRNAWAQGASLGSTWNLMGGGSKLFKKFLGHNEHTYVATA